MAKYKFQAEIVVVANSEEDALQQIGNHISTVRVRLANDHELKDCNPAFELYQDVNDAKPSDLRDKLPTIEQAQNEESGEE